MSFTGLRCLVTGTASGIGDAVTRRIAGAGAQVVSLDRKSPQAAVTQHVEVDLGDPDSIDVALAQIDGRFDVLINVAGIPGTAPEEQVFKVNFLGLRHLTESCVDRLNPAGSVVNVSSTAGYGWPKRLAPITDLLQTGTFAQGLDWFRRHQPEGNAYNFSKEAVTVYTMAAAGRLRQRSGLRINAVLPGPVDTPILVDFEESMGKDTIEGVRALIGRHATPDDIAGPVLFLASPDSRWVSGTTITADGGLFGAIAVGQVPAPVL